MPTSPVLRTALPLPSGSPLAELIQAHDWAATPLGPIAQWPPALRTAVGIAVGARHPMVVLWGEDLVQVYNDAYASVLGARHPHALGRPMRESWTEIWDTIGPMFESVRGSGQTVGAENLRLDMLRDGELQERYFTLSWSPLFGDGGQVEGVFSSAVETTEAMLGARRSEQERLAVLERMTDGFYALDRDRRFTYVNAAAERLVRRSRHELIGRPMLDLFPVLAGSRFDVEYQRALREQVPVQLEAYSPLVGAWIEVQAYPSPEGLSVFFKDVSERRRAEEAQRQLTEIIEATTDFVGTADPQGRTLFINRAGRRMLGYGEAEELAGTPIHAFSEPGSFERDVRPGIEHALREGSWRGESVLLSKDGREVPVSQVILAHRSASGEVAFLSTVARDMTEWHRAEERLRESEERYRSLFESNPQPMYLYDPDTLAFLAANEAMVAHYGYSREELSRMTIRDIRPPEELPRLMEGIARVRAGQRAVGVYTHLRKDGRRMQMELTVHRLSIGGRAVELSLANDVTERLKLEAQLRQVQKMEAVGQLAGGIAHDFNNLLAVMGTYGRAAQDAVPPGSELHEDLQEIVSAVDRAAGLTRQLLAFSRQQALVLERVDLNVVVDEAQRMLRRVIREDIRLVTSLDPALAPVHADRGQLEQVLLNLVVNARDAMPQGGTVTLATDRCELGAEAAARRGLSPGCYARLVVLDTGHGMDEATRQRLFEPFFTTKPVGKGTGLGLAMVYGIAQQLQGHVEVESAPGKGAAFVLLLPLSQAGEQGRGAHEAQEAPGPGGRETVLVVEDDAAVRRSVRRVLEPRGYAVLEASQGREALELLEARGGAVHLVLTDVVMPVMGGRELAGRVRERWPTVRTLLMSGHDPLATGATSGELISKPVTPDQLLRHVREALG